MVLKQLSDFKKLLKNHPYFKRVDCKKCTLTLIKKQCQTATRHQSSRYSLTFRG